MNKKESAIHSFVDFLEQPHVAAAMVAFALLALVFAVLQFAETAAFLR